MIEINNFFGEDIKSFITKGFGDLNILENREKLAENIGIPFDKNIYMNQIHGSEIFEITKNNFTDFFECDAIFTKEKGICLFVRSADCLPILFFDGKRKIIGAIHSGWKGTKLKILDDFVKKLLENGGDKKDFKFILGPCISSKNYEVGKEVFDLFKENFQKDGKYFVDLRKENLSILKENGIPENNIKNIEICTFENEEFFSYRRQKGKNGVFGSGIFLR